MSAARGCVAAIEAGGTKIVCALVDDENRIIGRMRLPTGQDPVSALSVCASWLQKSSEVLGMQPRALGAAWFGPIDLRSGRMRDTPKPGWSGADIGAGLHTLTGLPLALRSDVGAAAWAEYRCGAASGCQRSVYLTIGTGIGGGAVIDGSLLESSNHPEMGHVGMPPAADGFVGICRFHGDCLEGRCSGPAILRRFGRPAEELAADDPAWGIIAEDLAAGVHAIAMVLAPDRVVLGGGVADGGRLGSRRFAAMVSAAVVRRAGGYACCGAVQAGGVVPTTLAGAAGILGAAAAARDFAKPWDRW